MMDAESGTAASGTVQVVTNPMEKGQPPPYPLAVASSAPPGASFAPGFMPTEAAPPYPTAAAHGAQQVYYGTPSMPSGGQQQQVVYIYATPPPSTNPATVDPQVLNSRFSTLCGCHVITCCYVIGTLEALGLITGLIVAILMPMYASVASVIVSVVVGALVVPLFFYGLYKEKAGFVLPHIVYQGVILVGLGIGLIIFCAFLAVILIIVVLIAGILESYFMYQGIMCYRYLRAKRGGLW